MVSKQCLSKRFLSAGIVALSVLFVALVLCMASPAQAGVRSEGEEEIFFDDMEAGSGTWSVDPATGGWELGSPSGRPGEAHSGDNCWGTVLDGDYPAQRGESMVLSCEIDLGGFEGPTFSFWHWLEIESNHADAAYVEIRAEGEELWTLLWRNPGEDSRGGSYSTDGWEELTLSLESFVDSSIQLRFRLQSDGENNYRGWYVDDVEVQGEPLMKKDAATLGFLSPSAPESFVYKDEVKEIRVQVQNLGLEETVVPVRCLILDMDGEILRNRAEDSEILAPGEMASVLFQWRVPEELGQYYFRAYTELEGDEDPENDIQEVFVWVKGNYDLGLNAARIFPLAQETGVERSLIVDVWRSGDGAAIPLFRLSADIYFVYPDSGDEYLAASPYLDSDQLLDSSETTLTFRWAASREGNYRIEFRASILSSLDIEENLDNNSLEVEDVLAYSDLLLRDTREEGANPLFRNMTTDELEPWDHVTNDPFWTGDNKTGATGVQGWHVVAGGWNSPQSWYCGVPRDSRYANNADNSLVSQALNLEGYSNVGLSLLTRYYLEGRAYDNLRIYVSGDEENWTQLETYPGYGESNSAAEDGNHNSWLNKDYLLPDYVLNESFQIKLNFRSDNQINYAGVWLDDIQLYKLPDPDNYAPVAVIDSIGPQIVYQGEEVEFRGHGADDGSIKSYGWSSDIDGFLSDSDSFETSSLSPGNHSISFRVRDNEDLWSEKLWSSFLVRSPPSIQIEISHQRALENTAVAFLGTWLGEGEPDSLIWNSDIDGTLSTTKLAFCTDTLSPGEHIITLKGRDMNRVWSEEIQAIVLITQRPVALITGAPDNPVLDTETLELEGEAEGDVTIDAYAWRVLNKAGSEIYSGEAPPESLPVGDHTVYLKIMDDLWAWSEETQVTVLVHLRPTAIIHPLATVVVEGEDVLLAGKGEDDNGISRYVWTSSIDGQLQNSTKRNISTDSLSLGEHEISFLVLDGHGAWSHAAKTTLVVTEEPEAVIDRMVLGPILDDQHLILEGHGEDDGDIELLVWRSDLDGELYNGSETSVEVGPLSRGLHFLYLKVLDDSGVWSGEAETFVIVTKKPVAIIESVSPNPAKEGEAVEFQASTTDDADIHDHYVWSSDLDGELYNGSRTEFSTTGLSSGEHSISLIVQDNDGFWSEETTTSLTVEKKKSGGDDSPGFGLLFLVLVLALCATVVGKKRTR